MDSTPGTEFAGGMTEFHKVVFGVLFYLGWTKVVCSPGQWTVRIHWLHFQIFSMIDLWDFGIRTPDGSGGKMCYMRWNSTEGWPIPAKNVGIVMRSCPTEKQNLAECPSHRTMTE
jgi:hypothetical protein